MLQKPENNGQRSISDQHLSIIVVSLHYNIKRLEATAVVICPYINETELLGHNTTGHLISPSPCQTERTPLHDSNIKQSAFLASAVQVLLILHEMR